MHRNSLVPVMAVAIVNGIFSPWVLMVFLLYPVWYPSWAPAYAQIVYMCSALILSTLTIMLAGVPAALYERLSARAQTRRRLIHMARCHRLADAARHSKRPPGARRRLNHWWWSRRRRRLLRHGLDAPLPMKVGPPVLRVTRFLHCNDDHACPNAHGRKRKRDGWTTECCGPIEDARSCLRSWLCSCGRFFPSCCRSPVLAPI